jgi:hypothetical protein
MGSGTTLLRLILDSHPRIAIPQETGFMRAARAHEFIPFWVFGGGWYRRLDWTREELDEHLRAFYETMFSRFAERRGKVRWGEKTPWHVWHIDAMARMFPDAAFVAIVRHPGGNVASNMTRFTYTLRKAAYHYDRYNREIARQADRLGPRLTLLRYEDLVLQPEPVMRRLLEWLGEPWSARVVDHHTVQGARGEKTQVEGRTRADDPIDVSRISKWTGTIDEAGRESLQRRVGRLAEFYGYIVADPVALAPLSATGALLLDGVDVGRRIDEFPDLDLRTQPEVPRAEQLYRPRELKLERVVSVAEATPPRRSRALRQLSRRIPSRLRRPLRAAARRLRRG